MRDSTRTYMKVMGMAELSERQIDAMVSSFLIGYEHDGGSNPKMKVALGAVRDILQAHLPELVEQQGALIEKHYSEDDLRHLTAFYESPLGQRVLAVQPEVQGEANALGVQWALALSPEIDRALGQLDAA